MTNFAKDIPSNNPEPSNKHATLFSINFYLDCLASRKVCGIAILLFIFYFFLSSKDILESKTLPGLIFCTGANLFLNASFIINHNCNNGSKN